MADYLFDGNCYLNEQDNLVVIHHDSHCSSPRDYDNVGNFVTWMRSYKSPDDEMTPEEIIDDLGLWDEFEELHEDDCDDDDVQLRYLLDKAARKEITLLPVVGYEHSGLTLSTGDIRQFPDWQWDAGFAGVIYTTRERHERLCGTGEFDDIDKVLKTLKWEVDYYNTWLSGNCWGFTEYDHAGNEIYSLWGFIGETTDCIEHETGKLKDCEFSSLEEYVEHHKNDADVRVSRYNELQESARRLLDEASNIVTSLVEDGVKVKFVKPDVLALA